LREPMEYKRIAPDEIGFDFDGVIADIGEAFLRLAHEHHDYSLSLEEITSFQVETCTRIPQSTVNTIFTDILNDSLATGLLPIPGALEVISDLTRRSTVRIITARSLDQPVIDWLEHHLPADICRKIDVIAMQDHDLKVRFINHHNLRFFVDDRAETCVQVAQANLHPLLYRQPWNAGWNTFTVVDSWQQIAEHIAK